MRHRAVAAIAFATIGLACTAPPSLAAPLPVIYNGIYGYAHVSPTASPSGANNWSCKPVVQANGRAPDAGHPRARDVCRHVR